MDSEVPFTNLLRCNHHWPFCHVPTLTRLTLTNLTLTSIIMRNLTILFPVTRVAVIRRVAGHSGISPCRGKTALRVAMMAWST